MTSNLRRPELSVVVVSHNRPLRLRSLLNALGRQTLERSLWEVIVCHDSVGGETERVLAAIRSRPTKLFATPAWCLEPRRRAPTATPPCGWPARPPSYSPMTTAGRRPHGSSASTPPCASIVSPRDLVERLGGSDETVHAGEDADLCARVRAAGARFVGDPEMLTFHAVEEGHVLDWVRDAWRWGDLALLVKRHPELQRRLSAAIPLAAVTRVDAGHAGCRRPGSAQAAVVRAGCAMGARAPFSAGIHGRWRRLALLPGWAIIDLAEIVALARGSARHRAILL